MKTDTYSLRTGLRIQPIPCIQHEPDHLSFPPRAVKLVHLPSLQTSGFSLKRPCIALLAKRVQDAQRQVQGNLEPQNEPSWKGAAAALPW